MSNGVYNKVLFTAQRLFHQYSVTQTLRYVHHSSLFSFLPTAYFSQAKETVPKYRV